MSGESMWYYMDSTGQEFGPYPSSTMKGWFQQGFFPMQGELQVRLEEMGPEQHYYIKDLYPGPIMERAFDGEPNLPGGSGRNRGGGSSGGNRGGGGGGGGRSAQMASANPMDALGGANPYDGGLGLWGAMPAMMPGAMQAPGMSPFGFPAMRGGMMPGMGGMMPGSIPMPMGPGAATGRFQGRIKSFNVQKGFGFIDCPEAHQVYGRDVFLHKAQIADFQIGSQVSFAVEINKSNMPQARDLLESDMMAGFGGSLMGGVGMGMPGMGGAPKGYSNPKGGGKGKGRGGGNKGGNNQKGGGGGGAAPGGGGGEKKKGVMNKKAGAGDAGRNPPGPGPADGA